MRGQILYVLLGLTVTLISSSSVVAQNQIIAILAISLLVRAAVQIARQTSQLHNTPFRNRVIGVPCIFFSATA